jgi:hypothetical protein
MTRILHAAMTAGLILSVLGASAEPSDAARRKQPRAAGRDTVTTESWYGHGKVTAPVRGSGERAEVRMPGGTWIPCKQDCAQTLREESLDFWEELSKRSPSGGFQ